MIGRACALLLALGAPGQAQPASPAMDPPRLLLRNGAARAVSQLFAGGAGEVLAGEAVAPDARRSITLPAGACRFDLRVIYADGATEWRRGVDLCGSDTITLPLAAASRGARP